MAQSEMVQVLTIRSTELKSVWRDSGFQINTYPIFRISKNPLNKTLHDAIECYCDRSNGSISTGSNAHKDIPVYPL
jgi:hypothetical protein